MKMRAGRGMGRRFMEMHGGRREGIIPKAADYPVHKSHCFRHAGFMNATQSVLIDVLSSESFAEEHLPGAVNLCVYETAFLDNVRAQIPDTSTHLTIYGYRDQTREANLAVSILKAAGYQNVSVIPGGLEGCKSRGEPIERRERAQSLAPMRYDFDTEASLVEWRGSNLFNFHTGVVQLTGGYLLVEDGKLVEGMGLVDMTSIRCTDLTDSGLNGMLINHLRSTDFFDVAQFPLARFDIKSAEALGVTPGLPNQRIHGSFNLRGAIHPLEIVASVARKEDDGFVAQAFLDIDRTMWGSVYGSGKFFSRLGQHVVNDSIHLHLKIVTRPGIAVSN
jgi:polyisoprenoid-binding protein YceI/rhodanese-related sulfurtransferase